MSWAQRSVKLVCAACVLARAALAAADSDSDSAGDGDSAGAAPAAVSSATELAAGSAWSLRLSLGAGVGTRSLDLPLDSVIYEVRTGLFPAVETGFRLDYQATSALHIGLHARYQTSVGLQIVEQLTDGTLHRRAARAHDVDVAIVPSVRLDAAGLWRAAAALGYALGELDPEAHLVTPSYHLGGPQLRIELALPIAGRHVRLRLGPEVRWIVQIGRELSDRGVQHSVFGAGGSAALELRLGERWTLAASYRELRAWGPGANMGTFSEITRFITARVTGEL